MPRGLQLFKEFEEEVKAKNRFFPDEKFLRLFNVIIENEYNRKTIPEGTTLYRARRNELKGEFEFTSELGANKKDPSHNRASPIGIAYMYLADEPETAIAEVRANTNDTVTVASYKTSKPLEFLFLESWAVYGGDDGNEFDGMDVVGFIVYLSASFAAPVQKRAEIEYLPTQYFSEYCKKNGLAGIRYVSSARGFHGDRVKNHYNYVLFDDTDVCFQEAYKYRVEEINYTVTKECVVHLKEEGEK